MLCSWLSREAFYESLGNAGLDTRLRVVPALGHAYPRRAASELRTALEFLLPN